MIDANPAPYASADFTRTVTKRPAPRAAETFHLTPDMINGMVVIGGSIIVALAGMGLGAWLQLPFAN